MPQHHMQPGTDHHFPLPTPPILEPTTSSTTSAPDAAAVDLVNRLVGSAPASLFSHLQSATLLTPSLRPHPVLNAALTDLVRTLTDPHPPDTLAAAVALIDNSPTFAARAAHIRSIAAAAERELELFAADRVPAPIPASHLAPESALAAALPDFPYIDNYEHLVRAEAMILHGPLPDPALPSHAAVAAPSWTPANHREDNPSTALPHAAAPCSQLDGMVVAFCGSGPMPLTGIVLAARARAQVVLIDVDADAAAVGERVVRALERQGLLQPHAVRTVVSDAADVQFRDAAADANGSDSDREVGDSGKTVVSCHAVVLASLLPDEVKLTVARGLARRADAPKLMLVRSAVGLVARFAYMRTSVRMMDVGLSYCGEWVPAASGRGNRLNTADGGVTRESGRMVLGYIDASILNSIEVYRKLDTESGPKGACHV